MLLAAEFGDGDAFRRMAEWTDANLAIRPRQPSGPGAGNPDVPERILDSETTPATAIFSTHGRFLARCRPVQRSALAQPRDRYRRGPWAQMPSPCAPTGRAVPVLLPAEFGFTDEQGLTLNPSIHDAAVRCARWRRRQE